MEGRVMTVTLHSAENLPDVRSLGMMKVYAKVSINGSLDTIKKTPTDMEHETNPRWNFPVEYTMSEFSVQHPGTKLVITLYCERTLLEDKLIGEVSVPVRSLFERGFVSEEILSYQVGGTAMGKLHLSYSFGIKELVQFTHVIGSRKQLGSSSRLKKALKAAFWVLIGGTITLLGDNESDRVSIGSSDVRGRIDDADDDNSNDVRGRIDDADDDNSNDVQFYEAHSVYSEND